MTRARLTDRVTSVIVHPVMAMPCLLAWNTPKPIPAFGHDVVFTTRVVRENQT